MVSTNLMIFLNKYIRKSELKFMKTELKIKIFNRNLKVIDVFSSFNLAIHNGIFFIPVFIDNNKLNHMLAIFAFSFSIRLKKKIRVYKKKKKK